MLDFVLGFLCCYAIAGSIRVIRMAKMTQRIFGRPWAVFAMILFATWPVLIFDEDAS